ncbi:hypothetical protein FOZ62_001638 [Perkinsus olseni]|uniref:Uncharacterized protein n=1 Tax=Perkinsus olseni TaxID=32597 RepID=A0A7J6RZP4_PEROL|nr:hypothetical protein FOZ62_001638 [Perkinsus olseni]
MSVFLLLYFLTWVPLCGSTEYVMSNILPAATYKAVRRSEGKVCPALSRLIGFELVVTDGEKGQQATYSAEIEGVGLVSGRRATGFEDPAELVWYAEDYTKHVRSFGSLLIFSPLRCFHFEPKNLTYNFLTALFPNLTRTVRSASELFSLVAFCPKKFGIIVGIDPERIDRGRLVSYHYGVFLKSNISANDSAAERMPLRATLVGKKRNLFELVPEGTPAKVAKSYQKALREDNGNLPGVSSNAMSFRERRGAIMSSARKGSADSQLKLLGVPQEAPHEERSTIDSSWHADEHHTGMDAGDFALSVDYHATTSGGDDVDREKAAHQGSSSDEQLLTNTGGGTGESISVTVPDGEYTTRVEHITKLTVDVKTDPQTHEHWVKLTVELCRFEWPVYFSKVRAYSRDGCLYLDYSNEDHSMDTPLLEACLKVQPVSWDSFRICQRAGGRLALMFTTKSSNDTGAGSPNTSTIEIELDRIGDSGQFE